MSTSSSDFAAMKARLIANGGSVQNRAASVTPKGPGFYAEPLFHGEKAESVIEKLFVHLWVLCGGPGLEREVELVPDRKFRCDFVHEVSKTVIEINGFKDHTSAKGFHRDNEKHWALAKLGYQVITWDRKLINEDNVRDLIKLVTKR